MHESVESATQDAYRGCIGRLIGGLTIEFFNLLMQLKPTEQEKKDPSDFLRAL